MGIIERIAKVSFWINILFILLIFILPVIVFDDQSAFEKLTMNKGMNVYNLSFQILSIPVFFLWGYCIWFLFKYDRYSKSIIPLFFLNVLYAPIYYYRVKIKKRPLRNKINKPVANKKTENIIEEDDFNDLTRQSIFGMIKLWASIKEQQELQKIETENNLPVELFEQWKDFYIVDSETAKEIFSLKELELLGKFDNLLQSRYKKLEGNIPELNDFIKTDEWKEINLFAKEIIIELNIK